MQKKYAFTLIVGLLILVAIPLAVSAQGGQNRNGDGTPAQRSQSQFNNQMGDPNTQSQYQKNNQADTPQPQFKYQVYGRGNRRNQQMEFCMGDCANLPPAVEGELSEDVIAAMTSGIMDEYNAYNTYQQVIDQFGEIRPFVNIQRAEAQHASAWEMLFTRYGIEIPEAPAMEETLVFDSISDACTLAADAEIANFELYDEMLDTLADYPDMVQVVTQLRNVSEFNHLVAFEQCAG